MRGNPKPIWWRGIDTPVPASWAYMFEEFTDDDTAEAWALAAAIFVAQHRRRHRFGPTFSELFTHLIPDFNGLPAPFPASLEFTERRRALYGFRLHCATEWRRRDMITWNHTVTRSLRVARAFREQSHERQIARRNRSASSTMVPHAVAPAGQSVP